MFQVGPAQEDDDASLRARRIEARLAVLLANPDALGATAPPQHANLQSSIPSRRDANTAIAAEQILNKLDAAGWRETSPPVFTLKVTAHDGLIAVCRDYFDGATILSKWTR